MTDKKQQLVLSIIDFLNQSIEDGTIKQDDRESLEVAIQCIGEAFGVDPSDAKQRKQLSIKPATLQTIFDVFLKTKDRFSSSTTTPSTASPAKSASPSGDTKSKAEYHKSTGNKHMSSKDYAAAIEAYTNAISLDPTNPVYYSNRAAAHASKGDHSAAVIDSEKAIEVDPGFVKGYSRLGHAHYTLGNYRDAADAFQKGVELDPKNDNLKSGLKNALERVPADDDDLPPPLIPEDQLRSSSPPPGSARGPGAGATPNMSSLADMLGNMGGAGAGAGGMPDLASMMQNPMMMQMAQQLMANGGLERLMSNPSLANMMNRVQGGGSMPSMEELMSDPAMRDLASQFGGGAGSRR